ncbi:hypothetical protein [Dankookia sp. P2]|uniref:hypothetical protein n=1 Tax=Dankookia sp. P2 TaxID=3423955 RepID=UPI003D669ECD
MPARRGRWPAQPTALAGTPPPATSAASRWRCCRASPGWVADLTGPAEAPPEDIAGGAWRARLCGDTAGWPPAHAMQERRKYLVPAGGRTWLLESHRPWRRGRTESRARRRLAAAGLAPPVAGLRHGFLVQPWLAEAQRRSARSAIPRDRLAARAAGYLESSRPRLPCRTRPRRRAGGTARHGLRHNTATALGEAAAARLDRWTAADLARLGAGMRPVETDNRMQAWEWLALPDGAAAEGGCGGPPCRA